MNKDWFENKLVVGPGPYKSDIYNQIVRVLNNFIYFNENK